MTTSKTFLPDRWQLVVYSDLKPQRSMQGTGEGACGSERLVMLLGGPRIGYRLTDLARKLGMTQPGVGYAVRRGEKIALEKEVSPLKNS